MIGLVQFNVAFCRAFEKFAFTLHQLLCFYNMCRVPFL